MKKVLILILSIAMILILSLWFIFKPSKPQAEELQETANQETETTNTNADNTPARNAETIIEQEGEYKENGLPILMYHFFYDKSAGQTGKDNNWMEISDFEQQMKYLSENDYYFPSWEEVYSFVTEDKKLPQRSVVITIDDGASSFFELAIPVLKKYNITATSFLITANISKEKVEEYKSDILNFSSHTHDMHKGGKDGKGAILTAEYEDAYQDLKTSIEIAGRQHCFLLSIWTLQ